MLHAAGIKSAKEIATSTLQTQHIRVDFINSQNFAKETGRFVRNPHHIRFIASLCRGVIGHCIKYDQTMISELRQTSPRSPFTFYHICISKRHKTLSIINFWLAKYAPWKRRATIKNIKTISYFRPFKAVDSEKLRKFD